MTGSLAKLQAAKTWRERAARAFLLPGDMVCDWLKIRDEESRFLLRLFVNLAVYAKLAVLAILPFV